PSSSVPFTVLLSPVCSVRLAITNVLNPVKLTVSEYSAGSTFGIEYCPDASVVVVRAAAVPLFFRATDAPGTTAPELALIVPSRAAWLICPNVAARLSKADMEIAATRICSSFRLVTSEVQFQSQLPDTRIACADDGSKTGGAHRAHRTVEVRAI